MTKATKKPRALKKNDLAKQVLSDDNEVRTTKPAHEDIEVVFHSSSKEAIESCAHSKEMITALQCLLLKYQKETQAIGQAFKIKLDGRTVFNAQKI